MKKEKNNRSFLRELKRRRVLHTASLYVLGAWIALQVVEVLSGAGLPPTTLRHLLIGLSFGFPLALIVGWFFDISSEGVVKTGPLKDGEHLPRLKFIDHVLLGGLLKQLIGAIAPGLDPDPIHGPRAEVGECSSIYELYLRGKRLSKAASSRKRGVDMLREAVAIDNQCAIAGREIWQFLRPSGFRIYRNLPVHGGNRNGA